MLNRSRLKRWVRKAGGTRVVARQANAIAESRSIITRVSPKAIYDWMNESRSVEPGIERFLLVSQAIRRLVGRDHNIDILFFLRGSK